MRVCLRLLFLRSVKLSIYAISLPISKTYLVKPTASPITE